MSSSLPGALDLIRDSWTLFTKTWNDTVKISIWFIYFGLAEFLASLAENATPQGGGIISMLVSIGVSVFAVWVGIRLIRAALALDDGRKIDLSPAESQRSWQFFFPLILVGFLQLLTILGGGILLILPGIFLGVALSFSQMFVVDRGLRGTKALVASYELVKGRWWATLWRELAMGFVFGVGIMIVVGVVTTALAAVAGSTALSESPTPLVTGTFSLLQSIIQAATLPLFVIAQVKIYHALQRTR